MIARIFRLIFRAAGLVGLLIWFVMAILWIRSYFQGDCIVYSLPSSGSTHNPAWPLERTMVVISGGGGICLGLHEAYQSFSINSTPYRQWQLYGRPSYPTPSMWSTTVGTLFLFKGSAILASVNSNGTSFTSTLSPSTAPGLGTQIQVGGSNITLSGLSSAPQQVVVNGGQLNVSGGTYTVRVSSAGPRNVGSGTLIINGTAKPQSAGPTTSPNIPFGTLAPPPSPAMNDRWFIYYRAGNGLDPVVGIGNITHVLILPYWSILLGVSLPALLGIMNIRAALRQRRRIRRGCCPVCGYDLRATPERCPECGAVPETKPRMDSSQSQI